MGVMSEQSAHALGLDVLLWIAGDPERTGAFLGQTGTRVQDLRARADDGEFLGFVLDYILQGDDAVLAFCALHRHTPQDVMAARAALPGGDQPNWT